ncbi:MAG TPA: hypothetical protein VGF59_28430 [Bryobacteraceae bacterium]
MKTLHIRTGDYDAIVSGRFIRTARIDGDGYRFFEDPAPIVAALRESGHRVDLFTFIQRLPDTEPRHGYPMEWDNVAALELKSFDHWWNQQLGFKARNKAKQAEKKGVVLREVQFDESLARGIWEIYNETPIRQGRKFFNYGKTLETVRREASTFLDCSVFIGAFFEDKLIGFTKSTFDETGRQAGLMHIISTIEHRDKAPTNALIAHTVRACADRGVRYLVYANFAYGNKTHDSLSDFKERNAFQRIDVPRYYIPLNPCGQLALHCRLHLSLHHHLPETLINTYRKHRAAWYSRKYGMAAMAGAGSKAEA